jgi:DNA-binding XRE family transcriptional regulator
MIKNDRQFKIAQAKCLEGEDQLNRQIEGMKLRGYSQHEIQCITGCSARMLEQTCQEVQLYQRLKDRDASALQGLPINRQIIALRIYLGISQAKLASLLGIESSEVIRAEKNEYLDITLERYLNILQSMGITPLPGYVLRDGRSANEARNFLSQSLHKSGGNVILG